jgi:hypothetical protein
MSRHVPDLSVKRRTGEAGFGLLITRLKPSGFLTLSSFIFSIAAGARPRRMDDRFFRVP